MAGWPAISLCWWANGDLDHSDKQNLQYFKYVTYVRIRIARTGFSGADHTGGPRLLFHTDVPNQNIIITWQRLRISLRNSNLCCLLYYLNKEFKLRRVRSSQQQCNWLYASYHSDTFRSHTRLHMLLMRGCPSTQVSYDSRCSMVVPLCVQFKFFSLFGTSCDI